jgi:hypothetical protein
MAGKIPYCAPDRLDDFHKNGTCFDIEMLRRIAHAFNRQFPGKAISRIDKKNIRILKNELENRLQKECTEETCWVAKLGLERDPQVGAYLRPKTPAEWLSKPNTWLTNFNIEAVMFQYERKFPDFKFLGVFPVDFELRYGSGACMYEEICSLDLNKHKYVGFIINLDRHDEPGSHWTAIFIKDKVLYYYDSTTSSTPEDVKAFASKRGLKLVENKMKHQYGGSECGMFSIYYLVKWLNKLAIRPDITFEEIVNDKNITDANMLALRQVFFRPIHRFNNI